MIIDLTHNKIVRSTISDRFTESVDEVLIPLLRAKYGDSLLGIQMYEDYLADGFTAGKEWYYPLTLVTESGIVVEWIKWNIKKGDFVNDVPYAYVGKDALAFSLAESVPAEFSAKLVGRSNYFEGDTVKVRVETTATDVTVLAGRYSQTFIDEMARQLTTLLEKTMEVSGIADSSIEIAIVFTPDTYLEHTSENVTYRRLLIVDKSSSPRDLWIKWTRTDGEGAYSASDNVTSDSIVFELGENVSQKVREKEYRFLLRASKERYHKSMGRKNITEWRDVFKRAVRRGDLEKVGGVDAIERAEAETEIAVAAAAVEAVPETVEEVAAIVPENIEMTEDEELALAMEMARRAMDSVNETAGAEIVDDGADDEEEELDELDAFYSDDSVEIGAGVVADGDDEARELAEITRMALEALKLAAQNNEDEPAAVAFDGEVEEVVEISEEIEEIVDEDELDDEDAIVEIAALEPEETETVVAPAVTVAEPTVAVESTAKTAPTVAAATTTAELEAKIRGELEAKIRLEYEMRARERAEEEAERLRREQEQLRLVNE